MSNLKTMVLMASILVGSFLVMPNVSHAEDVWCYSNEHTSFYLDSDSVGETKNAPNGISYSASGKVVSNENGSFVNIMIYGFAVPNDNVVGYSYWRSRGICRLNKKELRDESRLASYETVSEGERYLL